MVAVHFVGRRQIVWHIPHWVDTYYSGDCKISGKRLHACVADGACGCHIGRCWAEVMQEAVFPHPSRYLTAPPICPHLLLLPLPILRTCSLSGSRIGSVSTACFPRTAARRSYGTTRVNPSPQLLSRQFGYGGFPMPHELAGEVVVGSLVKSLISRLMQLLGAIHSFTIRRPKNKKNWGHEVPGARRIALDCCG